MADSAALPVVAGSSSKGALLDATNRELPSFDGIVRVRSRAGPPSIIDVDTLLQPYDTRNQIFRSFNPCRILLTVILVASAVLLGVSLDQGTFRVSATVHDILSLEKCQEYCEKAITDTKKADKLGGSPLTKEECSLASFKQIDEFSAVCSFTIVKPLWQPLTVVVVFAVAIILIIQGLPSEVMLMGGASILTIAGIIDRSALFGGNASKGVVSLAVLFPISEAISETGILETGVGLALGSPKSLPMALLRMMGPVAFLSAFLSNTATVALMIPVLVTWSRRLNVHPGKLLMPLSFAAQLGGSMTVLGSSHCLVAKSKMDNGKPLPLGYNMGMMDLFPVGFLLLISLAVVITISANTQLLKSSGEKTKPEQHVEDSAATESYLVKVIIDANGPLVGNSLEESGLTRIPGVIKADRAENCEEKLQASEEVAMWVTDSGIVALRAQVGLQLRNHQHLAAMGGMRRQRSLFEVCVDHDSEILTTNILSTPSVFRLEYGGAFVAGPKSLPRLGVGQIRPGSVLIVEADRTWVSDKAADKWRDAFSLIRRIPNSAPLRIGGPVDRIRGISVCLGMVLLIILTTFDKETGVTLDVGGSILLLFYLMIRAISFDQLFGSMKTSVLFTIVGALAMGNALEDTGIVDAVSGALMGSISSSLSVTAMVYALAVFLSMFINNSATVAILGPMILSLVKADPTLNLKGLTWTLVYAAGSCFTTPLGYQTNLMVCPDGKYEFQDFCRFGALIQLVHMVLTVAFVMLAVNITG